MTKRVNFFISPNKKSDKLKGRIQKLFEDHGYQVCHVYQDDADFNVVIGGDGTFFRAVHTSNFSPIPFVGINTGNLGYFQEIDTGHISEYMDRLFQGRYRVETLGLLDSIIETSSWTYKHRAVNEFVISPNDKGILRVKLSVDGVPLIDQAGDGLLFSTPSGSTAYGLSAGGSILYQTLDGYQIVSLAPLRSKKFHSLPAAIVVPSSTVSTLNFAPEDRDRVILTFDGTQDHFLGLEQITIKTSDLSINRIVFNPNWYWYNLQDKLIRPVKRPGSDHKDPGPGQKTE